LASGSHTPQFSAAITAFGAIEIAAHGLRRRFICGFGNLKNCQTQGNSSLSISHEPFKRRNARDMITFYVLMLMTLSERNLLELQSSSRTAA
jgi:hypothetical protein